MRYIRYKDLLIALPKEKDTVDFENDRWSYTKYPKELSKIKSVFDWEEYPLDFKEKWYDYIDKEFTRREEGFWFINKDKPTYITGTNYMYLQWSKIDVGQPDFRESNRLFYIFWEACKADKRSYGMCYLKNIEDRFLVHGISVSQLTMQQYQQIHGLGYCPNLVRMQKKCLLIRSYQFQSTTRSSSSQSRTVWTGQRPNSRIRVPASKFTRRKLDSNEKLQEITGLDTTIDWKNTGDNSYDGEKLKLLVHDESGKWERPTNILNNWRVTRTCLRLGSRIIGKCMMGSTSNALDKGGETLKNFTMIQMLHKETPMDRLAQDSILCSYLWNGTTKDTLILMAFLYSTHQKKK